MTKTVFPPAIPSRPVYGVLTLQSGPAHLIVADGEGAAAVVKMLAGADIPAGCHILYTPGPNGCDQTADLRALHGVQLFRSPSIATLLPRLQKLLADAHMGVRIYAAGTEGLIAQVARAAADAGFPYEAVQTEHRGSTLRRVQCVHCKGITENVAFDPFPCSHCGLQLFVRDHFSRRHAAFQGVNIDAEDPGLVPAAVERFR